MAENLLLNSQCKRARPHAKVYRKNDGGGLSLIIHPDGRKYWQFRFSYDGRQRLLQIGPYPAISLDAARKERTKHRGIVQAGKDPVVARKLEKMQQVRETADSLGAIAYEWLEHFKSDWSEVHYERNEGLIRRILMPKLGALPIKEVDITALLSVLRSAEAKGILMSARRARTIASQIFAYAISTGRATHNPARDLLGAMRPRPQTKHHAALKLSEVGPMLNALADAGTRPATQAALKLMLYTGLRDFSLRAACSQEIDFNAAVWTVPAERMKGRKDKRKPHAVPLPKQAVAVLKHLQPLTERGPDSFVFPGPGKAGCLSENTLCHALRTLGFDVTAHGLRSLITDALYEAGFRSEAIERQFSHADRSEVRAAYLRSDFLDYRHGMMQHWANMCDALKAGKPLPKMKAGNVLPMHAAA